MAQSHEVSAGKHGAGAGHRGCTTLRGCDSTWYLREVWGLLGPAAHFWECLTGVQHEQSV
jgi:hypothetical protein